MIDNYFEDPMYPFPTELQQTLSDYYDEIRLCMDKRIKTGYAKEVMGHEEVQMEWDKVNNFHYLAVYLIFMAEDIAMDVENGDTYTVAEYAEEYQLECIRKAILCTGCNIDSALGVFGQGLFASDTLRYARFDVSGTLTNLLNYFKRC